MSDECSKIKIKRALLFKNYTHTHTHVGFYGLRGTLHRRNGFYAVQTVCAIALHLNLALTGDGISTFPPKNSLCVIYKHF